MGPGAILPGFSCARRWLRVLSRGRDVSKVGSDPHPMRRPRFGELTTRKNGAGSVVSSGYDAVGNQVSLTYPDGTTTAQGYDAVGALAGGVGAAADCAVHFAGADLFTAGSISGAGAVGGMLFGGTAETIDLLGAYGPCSQED